MLQGHAHLLTKVSSALHFRASWQPYFAHIFLHSLSPLFTSISLHNFMASGSAVLFWLIDIENIERGK